MNSTFSQAKEFLKRYERHISSLTLLIGFVIDSLTLRRVDLLFENAVIVGYLFVAILGIGLSHLYETRTVRWRLFEYLSPLFPLAIQFAFGGLFSAFLIFYFRSAAIGVSWPYVAVLAGLLIANEAFKKYYSRLVFNVSVLFYSLFSFFIFSVPLVVGRIGTAVFFLSGLVALAVIIALVKLLFKVAPKTSYSLGHNVAMGVAVVYLLINSLYFSGFIPPIPLSLKEIGVYHNVLRVVNSYIVIDEQDQNRWFRLRDTIHVPPNQPVYVFSSVFAPAALQTNIVHHWQRKDAELGWVSEGRISFPMSGGRDQGYRGYTTKSAIAPGVWRVDVETPNGQVVGRITFKVVEVAEPVAQVEKVF